MNNGRTKAANHKSGVPQIMKMSIYPRPQIIDKKTKNDEMISLFFPASRANPVDHNTIAYVFYQFTPNIA